MTFWTRSGRGPLGEHTIVRRRRIVGATVAAALAVVGLAACRSNVGTAARVDGHRITESDVNRYLAPAGVASDRGRRRRAAGTARGPSVGGSADGWSASAVFQQTLDRYRISTTAGELAAEHDRAGSLLVGAQMSGAALDRRIDQLLTGSGLRTASASACSAPRNSRYLLVEQRKITTQAQLSKAVKPIASKVSVSPRYGAWDVGALQLGQTAGLPSFVARRTPGGRAVPGARRDLRRSSARSRSWIGCARPAAAPGTPRRPTSR